MLGRVSGAVLVGITPREDELCPWRWFNRGCFTGETRPRTFRSGVLVAEIFWNLKILCLSSPSEPTATHMFTTSSGPVCELAEPSCMNEARGTVATCFGWWFYDSFGAGFWELREKFQKLVSTQI